MQSFVVATILLVFGLASGCSQQPERRGEQTATVQGTAKLEGKNDHSGIVVSSGDSVTETGADGSYTLQNVPVGKSRILATKEGFKDTSKVVEVKSPQTQANLTLVPDDTDKNTLPSIASISAKSRVLSPGDTTTVTVSANDSDEDQLTYKWTADGEFTIKKGGDSQTATIRAPDSAGVSAQIGVEVSDGNGGTVTGTIQLRTTENHSPTILSMSTPKTVLSPGETIGLVAKVNDPDGDELSYEWTAKGDFEVEKKGDGNKADVTAPSQSNVQGEISLRVTDSNGGEARASRTFETSENQSPQIVSLTANPPQVEPTGVINLAVTATDPDGDDLTYQWSAPPKWKLTSDEETAKVEAPDKFKTSATIKVVVSDGEGGKVEGNLSVSTTKSAQAPLITSLTANPKSVSKGGTIQLRVNATDPRGGSLSYAWEAPSNWQLTPKGARAEITAPTSSGKTATVKITVTSASGKKASASTVVSTQPNQQPIIASLTGQPNPVAPDATMTLDASANDPDGDSLSYTWSVQSSDWTFTGSGSTVELKSPNRYDASTTLKVKVSDQFGGSTTANLPVSTYRCKQGTGDCDGNASNGCEVNLSTNDSHCSACGNVCQGTSKAKGVCRKGQCELVCKSGFADCDNNPSNGCESLKSGLTKTCSKAASCREILNNTSQTSDGVYWIDPLDTMGSSPIKVRCEMQENGGGWTRLNLHKDAYQGKTGLPFGRNGVKWGSGSEFNWGNGKDYFDDPGNNRCKAFAIGNAFTSTYRGKPTLWDYYDAQGQPIPPAQIKALADTVQDGTYYTGKIYVDDIDSPFPSGGDGEGGTNAFNIKVDSNAQYNSPDGGPIVLWFSSSPKMNSGTTHVIGSDYRSGKTGNYLVSWKIVHNNSIPRFMGAKIDNNHNLYSTFNNGCNASGGSTLELKNPYFFAR